MPAIGGMGPRARLRALARHVAAEPAAVLANPEPGGDAAALGGAGAPLAASTTDAMPPRLLSDAQLKAFVRQGYVNLPITELPQEFHNALDEKAQLLNGPYGGALTHNNIYPSIPELGTVMRSPTVRGALQSVLGTDYVMHACRAFHNSDGRDSDQAFHKVSRLANDAVSCIPQRWLTSGGREQDGLEGHGPVRHHRPRWAMIMYVPLGSSLEMGPT